MLDEFKKFAMRGNAVDMAIGIIIGAAFGTVVRSLVDDVLMPPLGLLLGGADFTDLFIVLREGAAAAGPYASLAEAQAAGAVTVNYGLFANNILAFLIVAWAVFLLVRAMNRLQRKEEAAPPPPSMRVCPFCATEIPIAAKRCPNCTSEVAPA